MYRQTSVGPRTVAPAPVTSTFRFAPVLIAGMMALLRPATPMLAACPEDLNGNGVVGATDLALLLGDWGPCSAPCPPCAVDLNGDCDVNASDLALLLGAWGDCPADCCIENGSPGCANPACQDCVCALDPSCCDTAWTESCAACAAGTGGSAACQAAGGCPAECSECDVCGNAFCGPDETASSCAADCPHVCGDGVCGPDETAMGCPSDCDFCGNAFCGPAEDCVSCASDCGGCGGDCCAQNGSVGCDDAACQDCVCSVDPFCCDTDWNLQCVRCAQGIGGSAFCQEAGGCAVACPQCDLCGNGFCGPAETAAGCPFDCGDCGDGTCGAAENCANCAVDCGACVGDCCAANGSEGCDDLTCQNCVCTFDPFCCEGDWDDICGACAAGTGGNGVCVAEGGCADQCPQCDVCDNGFCGPSEDCVSCPADCGPC